MREGAGRPEGRRGVCMGRMRGVHVAGVLGETGRHARCGHLAGAGRARGGYGTCKGQAHGRRARGDWRAGAWLVLGGCAACAGKARVENSFHRGH